MGLTTYIATDDVGAGRPACARCGAAYGLHGPVGLTRMQRAGMAARGQLACPSPYRVDTLAAAQRELVRAEASGDAARVFVARGDVQRLLGEA